MVLFRDTNKEVVLRTLITVFLVLGLLAVMPILGSAADLPTFALSRSTAYTLNRGELQVGSTFSFLSFGVPGVSVEYGIADYLQLGTSVTGDIEGDLNLKGKVWLLQVGTVDVAFPFALWIFPGTGFSSHIATIMSWQAMSSLSVHVGTWVGVYPYFYYSPYLIMDLHPVPDLALIGEVSLRPSRVALGIRITFWKSLSFRVAAGLKPFSFWGELSARI